MKRIGLFVLVNLLVLTTIGIITTLLGVGPYMTAAGLDYYSLFIFAAIIGFTGSLISLAISRWTAKRMMHVQVLDPNGVLMYEERQLVNSVYQLAKRAGLQKMPQVGIYPSSEVNAFATGPSRNRSLVAVSQGLLERMDWDAVEGVLAHEISHVSNGDMVTMTLLQGVINTFVVFLSRIIAYIASLFVDEEVQGIVHLLCAIIFQILLAILGSIAVMAYSRRREFAADRDGATLAGRQKMLHALHSLQKTIHLIDTDQEALASFKVSGENRPGLRKLFSTHPDLEERIQRLESGR